MGLVSTLTLKRRVSMYLNACMQRALQLLPVDIQMNCHHNLWYARMAIDPVWCSLWASPSIVVPILLRGVIVV